MMDGAVRHGLLSSLAMPQMDRRRMLATGIGVLAAAALPVANAQAYPSRPDAPVGPAPAPAAPAAGPAGGYLWHDEFDGRAGSAPDPS